MKILIIHNYYRQRGGEDVCVEAETALLRENGHDVTVYSRSNDEIPSLGFTGKVKFFVKDAVWSKKTYDEVKQLIRGDRPDIAYVHNVFSAITPSVYDALHDEGVPIAQRLHNYRFFCPNGVLFRHGRICEACSYGNYLYSIVYGCWRRSNILSFLLQRVLGWGVKRRTFEKIDCFIVPNEFSKKKFVAKGFPEGKIKVKPNFTYPPAGYISGKEKEHALFMGRLSSGKGIFTLLNCWKHGVNIPLKIAGDGELRKDVEDFIVKSGIENVELLGWQDPSHVRSLLDRAMFLIWPSECYEFGPVVILEALAAGVPVIASRIGSAEETIKDRYTGLLFKPGDHKGLLSVVRWALENRDELEAMGNNARLEFEKKYSPAPNYAELIGIFEEVLSPRNNRPAC